MRIPRTLLTLVTLLWLSPGAIAAQNYLGTFIYNGLPDTIVDGHIAYTEKCDVYKCGQWIKRDPDLFPMDPDASAAIFRLTNAADKSKQVCVLDIKIVTLPADQGPLQEHIFRGLNFCTPQPPILSFVMSSLGPYVVQSYEDGQGAIQMNVVPSQAFAKTIPEPAKPAEQQPSYQAVLFYNGLSETIVDGYAARAERCDVFLCGKWRQGGKNILPLAPYQAAALFQLPSNPDNRVCQWDLKIVTAGDGGKTSEHVFKDMNLCASDVSIISFEQAEFGVFAFQTFENARGNVMWEVVQAQ